ncbi:Fc.00g097020.m01.CDS01 [Cosmosporella sp. VM-42]
MLSKLASRIGLTSTPIPTAQQLPKSKQPIKTSYTSNDIPIPDTFLTTPPTKPITSTPIDWTNSPLPQYKDHIALILDNVLSPEECKEILALAEASVPKEEGASSWRPALVSLGPGWEAPAPGYRESDRIIWNEQTVVDRLWERCSRVDGLKELLATVPPRYQAGGGQWEFRRFNERMRFLKYSPGQYFKPHCDGPYWYEEGDKEFQTHYTVHLYLNDSIQNDPQSELVGGATAFLERRGGKRVDVNPKAGSVLIFQHKGLFHEGAKVNKGIKYTMRTDILYEWVPETEPDKKEDKETEGATKGST